jgi:hypothetical protein
LPTLIDKFKDKKEKDEKKAPDDVKKEQIPSSDAEKPAP